MKTINIQSISDLITNSSTEAFVVYDQGNVEDIKNLVNSILSLLDSSKTFDDYFTIEMLVNYEDLDWILGRHCNDETLYEEIPELKTYNEAQDVQTFLESLTVERIEAIFEWENDSSWEHHWYPYEGFMINAKSVDPTVQKVATVINSIDNIFSVDYSY